MQASRQHAQVRVGGCTAFSPGFSSLPFVRSASPAVRLRCFPDQGKDDKVFYPRNRHVRLHVST